jgi:hypothetical protein
MQMSLLSRRTTLSRALAVIPALASGTIVARAATTIPANSDAELLALGVEVEALDKKWQVALDAEERMSDVFVPEPVNPNDLTNNQEWVAAVLGISELNERLNSATESVIREAS